MDGVLEKAKDAMNEIADNLRGIFESKSHAKK